MSKIALSGNALGTGTITLAAPNTNTDRTLTLPDAAGTVFVSGQAVTATTGNFSGNVTLGSSVLATPSGSAPSFMCRAFVNFNGTGTVAIRASGNVSSITDQGTGLYVVNLATAMPDANYSVVAFAYKVADNSGNYRGIATGYRSPSTTSFGVHTGTAQIDDVQDFPIVTAAIFR